MFSPRYFAKRFLAGKFWTPRGTFSGIISLLVQETLTLTDLFTKSHLADEAIGPKVNINKKKLLLTSWSGSPEVEMVQYLPHISLEIASLPGVSIVQTQKCAMIEVTSY